MAYVNDVLDEFDGQLSKDDIYAMTYKELGYLRRHRKETNKRKGGPSGGLNNILR